MKLTIPEYDWILFVESPLILVSYSYIYTRGWSVTYMTLGLFYMFLIWSIRIFVFDICHLRSHSLVVDEQFSVRFQFSNLPR
ncbi:hypothetical protein C3414_08860 [Serratia sp. SSNIH2]|nr:hypothetical protein C3F38_23900 [Serratia sp. SSNIH1]POW39702.1 hypothetical protein C3396_08750 [Serratia sp. SSNIH5]POW40101.1 hypothetical protein C3414_08860 [Serratia sp. SSNIH2]POW62141.1 hypothetical protein C3403_08380 [Serratia sp. SSNIH3]